MKADIWMPFYVADYLSDTGHLTTEQHGAYFLLLCHQWRTGSVPTDPKELARLTRCSLKVWNARIAESVLKFFDPIDGALVQKRLRIEAEKSIANRKKKADAAQAKWDQLRGQEKMGGAFFPPEGKLSQTENHEINGLNLSKNNGLGDAHGYAHTSKVHMQNGCPSPSPSPLDKKEEKDKEKSTPLPPMQFDPTTGRDAPGRSGVILDADPVIRSLKQAADAEFEQWWQAYPRKVGKGHARRAYHSAIRTKKVTTQRLLDSIREQKFDPRPQFVPMPATWLNGERWLDEIDNRDPVLVAVGHYDAAAHDARPDSMQNLLKAISGGKQ